MLRNAPIRTKLLVSLLGPLLVLAVLALVGIRQNQAESQQAGRSTAFARLAAGLAPLVHELQDERSLSVNYIDSGRTTWGRRLAEQRRTVDRSLPPTGPTPSAWAPTTSCWPRRSRTA
jgi:hypothetical protein